jgi:CDP-glucose 4,6-dehydratase
VTGATGFLGSHLVARLLELGADVAILRRGGRALTPISAAWIDRVTVVDGGLDDRDLLTQALLDQRPRTIFHLAAQSQVSYAYRNPVEALETNVRGTWNLLEAARESRATGEFLFASSDKVYGSLRELPYREDMTPLPRHPYDVSKACGETIVQGFGHSYGIHVAITRCANLYGPGDGNWLRIVPSVLRAVFAGRRPVLRSDGSFVRDYLFVKDAVLAYLTLAEQLSTNQALAGEAFNFSAEAPLSVLEMIERLQAHAGTSLEPMIEPAAPAEVPAVYLSAEKARKRLAWKPQYAFDDALAETVAYYAELAPSPPV